MKDFAKILQTGKTVFSVEDLYQIFSYTNIFSLRNMLSKMGKNGLLLNVAKGIRTLPKYNHYELANILQKPSYISLETVLAKEGIIFQSYGNTFFSVGTQTREFILGDTTYLYKTIKKEILLDPLGISYSDGYAIACAERAICDRLYLTPHYYFDNLRSIDWEKLEAIATIYDNKRLLLDVKHLKDGTRY